MREQKNIDENKVSTLEKVVFCFVLVILPLLIARGLLRFQIHKEKLAQATEIKKKLHDEYFSFIQNCSIKDVLESSFLEIQKELSINSSNPYGQKLVNQKSSKSFEAGLVNDLKSSFKKKLGFYPILIFTGTPSQNKYASYADEKVFQGLSRPGKLLVKKFVNYFHFIDSDNKSDMRKFSKFFTNLLGKSAESVFVEGKINVAFTEKFGGDKLYIAYKNFKSGNNKFATSFFFAFMESQFAPIGLLKKALNKKQSNQLVKKIELLPIKKKFGFKQTKTSLTLIEPIPFLILKQNALKLNDIARTIIKAQPSQNRGKSYPFIKISAKIPKSTLEDYATLFSLLSLIATFLALFFTLNTEFIKTFWVSIRIKLWFSIVLILFFPGALLYYNLSIYQKSQHEELISASRSKLLDQQESFDSKLDEFYLELRKKLDSNLHKIKDLQTDDISELSRIVTKSLNEKTLGLIVLRSDGKFVAKFSSRLEKMGVRKQQLDFLEKMFLSFGLRILTIAGDADENSSQSLSEKLKGIDVFSSALTDVDIDSFLLSDGLPIEMAQANNSMIQMIPSFYFLDKKRNKKSFSYTVLTVFDKQRVLIDFMNSEKTGLWINSGKIRANDESSYVFQVDSDPSSVNKGFQAIRSWPESALSNKVLLEAAKKVSQNESYKTWEEVDENGFRTLWSAKTNLGYPIVTLIVKELKELEIQNSRLFLLKLFAVFYAFVVFSIVATILSQSFLKPIQLLKQASEDFQKGLLPDISAIHTNELGNVIVSFNHMIEGFKKRKLLERFLSKETTEMVISSKDSEAENNLKKQHRVILFTHIIQFDEIVDRLSPECLMEILNAFFGSMEPIIKSHHGEIDKYIGDAIMVTFATIPGLKSAEERACQTAISMKKASNDLNHALQKSKLPEINFGIGIANGSVITGKIGSKDFRKDFTVIGDPVNLAARLESKSHSYRDFVCLVSEQIQKSVSNAFLFSKIGEVPIKGKSQLVSIYGLANGKKCHAE